MCGILAVLPGNCQGDERSRLVRSAGAALDVISHRGPDDSGWALFSGTGSVSTDHTGDERTHLAVGFRRLSIFDLSPAGHQPMRHPQGRYWIAFNGEIYNHTELRAELEAAGERFVSRSDTEVLLRLLARDGVAALSRLDGMFALMLIDTVERRLLLARDPFGIKPLYIWKRPRCGLAFASEIKQFSALDGWSPRADGERFYDFLLRGVLDHTERTMFAGVEQLPGGHFATVGFGPGASEALVIGRWHTPGTQSQRVGDDGERVRSALFGSVQRQLRADVRVGSCLSGGLDSTSIVACACQILGKGGAPEFRTFTARPERATDETPDEWPLVQQTLAMTGARGTPVSIPELGGWDELARVVWLQDEPFSSTSILAQAAVFREAARQGVKVMLDGQGADEQLCGYDVFFRFALAEQVRKLKLLSAWQSMCEVRRVRDRSIRTQLAELGAVLAPGIGTLVRPRPAAAGWIDGPSLANAASDPFERLPEARDIRSCSMQQLMHASVPMLLHWEDRNSMAVSVEARVPFLSPDFVA